MNSNFEPKSDATDDVEAHTATSKHIDGPDNGDVVGHSIRGNGVTEDTDNADVEGHGIKTSHINGPATDDVEAHTMRGKLSEEDDDVEGHGHTKIRVEASADDVEDDGDVEGHSARGKV